jgi:hypothetical protein
MMAHHLFLELSHVWMSTPLGEGGKLLLSVQVFYYFFRGFVIRFMGSEIRRKKFNPKES